MVSLNRVSVGMSIFLTSWWIRVTHSLSWIHVSISNSATRAGLCSRFMLTIFYVSTSKVLTNEFISKVEKKFGKVKHKDGNTIPFLDMRITKATDGTISVDQPMYVSELVEGMFDERRDSSPSHRDILSRDDPENKLLRRTSDPELLK
jgi:hypothetical protein